ncbi:YqhR family membrane protein [Tepidibacillus sp. HK-1]|uniref:YqhR family membrane protein n=1 Tax=Tepidibacillus sp. HK-1 TaxID=1883407 RepID=UPI0008537345|nr:YqhR family membrane protein [Tepidibacillus sp. HK-1]GBF11018.1 hypothetical protein HK1_01036 [Tepidibacillus sp. HK-1]
MKNQEQNQSTRVRKKKFHMAISIGISAGILWGLMSLVMYYLQFTDVGPSIFAKPFLNPDYDLKWQGHFVGVGFFIFYALIAAFLYAKFLAKYKSPWVGIAYGLALWAFVFIVLNPLLNLTKPLKELGWNTNSVMFSLFILIGLFIGYSLSAEFNNQEE